METTMPKKKQGAASGPVQFRQGDVFIERVDDIPAGVSACKADARGVVLAEGEATGHHHRIGPMFRSAKLFDGPEGAKFLKVGGTAPVALTHEEHSPVDLPPGNYRVTIQREYSPDAVRQVED
jgi:hypothetical protein